VNEADDDGEVVKVVVVVEAASVEELDDATGN
jgi:hypothetical protein